MENLTNLSKLDTMYDKVHGGAGIYTTNTVNFNKTLLTPVTSPVAMPTAMAAVKLPTKSNAKGDNMLLYIALIGATAVTIYLIYDWQKRKQAEKYKQ